MKILIGSRALRHFFPEFDREGDWDYIVGEKPKWTPSCVNVEYHLNPIFDGYEYKIMLPNDLYTLKMSHMFWNINWEKHMWDIQFLRSKGCRLNKELFYKLYDYWNTVHEKNKRSDLKMTAGEFFNNAITCPYSHDFLHTLINPIPTYTKVLVGEVEVGEDKFNLLSYNEKCKLVIEEVEVMAYERMESLGHLKAYGRMLKKFIISHAPLWEAIFIIENFIALHKSKRDFIKIINDKLNEF